MEFYKENFCKNPVHVNINNYAQFGNFKIHKLEDLQNNLKLQKRINN